jgi:hypothetical protein
MNRRKLPRLGTKARAVVEVLGDGKLHRWKEFFEAYRTAGKWKSNEHYISLTLSRLLKKYADRPSRGVYQAQLWLRDYAEALRARGEGRYWDERCAVCAQIWGDHFGDICPLPDKSCPEPPDARYFVQKMVFVPAVITAKLEEKIGKIEQEMKELQIKLGNKETYIEQLEAKLKGAPFAVQTKIDDLASSLQQQAAQMREYLDDQLQVLVDLSLDLGEVSADIEAAK